MVDFLAKISAALTMISEACPRVPARLGINAIVALGRLARLPGAPADSNSVAIPIACPKQIVYTSDLMCLMVS